MRTDIWNDKKFFWPFEPTYGIIGGTEVFMKYIYTIFTVLVCSVSCAQQPVDVLSSLESTINIANGSNNGMGQAAITNANANYVLKSSMANINNQKAYGLSINNDVLKTSSYFEKRQINLYNRTLEEFQKKQISQMRRYKVYSKEHLDSLFDVRYKTGYIMP